jgi:hypothetical protein
MVQWIQIGLNRNSCLDYFFFFFKMEDGLQLNFVVDEPDKAPRVPKLKQVASNLKRGGWKKKRMDAKKIVQKVKKNIQSPEGVEQKSTGQIKQVNVQAGTGTTQTTRSDIPKGFSSSIFTSNPEAPHRSSKFVQEVVDSDIFTDANFRDLGIHKVLVRHLEKQNINAPTKIQRLSIPALHHILDKDIIIQSQTGTVH